MRRTKLAKRLRVVWENSPPKRYVPLSIDGGTGWRTFDTVTGAFLSDDDLLRLSPDQLATAMAGH